MGNAVFYLLAQFGKTKLGSFRDEKRIVTEPCRSARLGSDTPETFSNSGKFPSFGRSQRYCASEIGAPVFHSTKIGKEQFIVAHGIGRLAGISGAEHARRSSERSDLQTRIVGHAPTPGMNRRYRSYLQKRIAGKIGSALHHPLGILRNDFKSGKNLGYFPDFVLIAGGYVYLHPTGNSLYRSSFATE